MHAIYAGVLVAILAITVVFEAIDGGFGAIFAALVANPIANGVAWLLGSGVSLVVAPVAGAKAVFRRWALYFAGAVSGILLNGVAVLIIQPSDC